MSWGIVLWMAHDVGAKKVYAFALPSVQKGFRKRNYVNKETGNQYRIGLPKASTSGSCFKRSSSSADASRYSIVWIISSRPSRALITCLIIFIGGCWSICCCWWLMLSVDGFTCATTVGAETTNWTIIKIKINTDNSKVVDDWAIVVQVSRALNSWIARERTHDWCQLEDRLLAFIAKARVITWPWRKVKWIPHNNWFLLAATARLDFSRFICVIKLCFRWALDAWIVDVGYRNPVVVLNKGPPRFPFILCYYVDTATTLTKCYLNVFCVIAVLIITNCNATMITSAEHPQGEGRTIIQPWIHAAIKCGRVCIYFLIHKQHDRRED